MRPTGGVGVAGRAGWAAGSWGELWEEALRGWGAVKGPAIDLPVLGKKGGDFLRVVRIPKQMCFCNV